MEAPAPTNAATQAPQGEAKGLVSVVVPTYKEAPNLPLLVPEVAEVMRRAGEPLEIIIVDDDSGDGSDVCVAQLAAQGYPVRIMVRKGRRGLSSAVIEGFNAGKGEFLVCMDADLSHPPQRIVDLLGELRRDADFALGSRYVPGAQIEESWSLLRYINSFVATQLARPLVRVKDPMSGFFALRRSTYLGSDPLCPIGYKIALELIVKCHCRRVREVPIRFANRKLGRSKLSLREQLNYLRHIARLYAYKFGRGRCPSDRTG